MDSDKTKLEGDGAGKAADDLKKTTQAAKETAAALNDVAKAKLAQAAATNAALTAEAGRGGKSAADSASVFTGARFAQDAKDTAAALSAMTKETKSFKHEADKAAVSLKGLGGAAYDAVTQLPLVGGAVAAMSNPITAAIALASAATTAFTQWNAAINELAISQQSFTPSSNGFQGVARAMQDVAALAADFQEAMRLQESSFSRVSDETARQVEAIHALTDANRQALAAEKQLALF